MNRQFTKMIQEATTDEIRTSFHYHNGQRQTPTTVAVWLKNYQTQAGVKLGCRKNIKIFQEMP